MSANGDGSKRPIKLDPVFMTTHYNHLTIPVGNGNKRMAAEGRVCILSVHFCMKSLEEEIIEM
jgi:hypothetical protein